MTLNPESLTSQTIRSLQHTQNEHQEVKSEKDMKEEQ